MHSVFPVPLKAVGSPKPKHWRDTFKYLQAIVPDCIEVFWSADAARSLCVLDHRQADGQDRIMIGFAAAHGQGVQVADMNVLQPLPEDYLLRSTTNAAAAAASSSSSSDEDGDGGGGGGGGGSTRRSGGQRARRPTRPLTTPASRGTWFALRRSQYVFHGSSVINADRFTLEIYQRLTHEEPGDQGKREGVGGDEGG